MKFQASRKLRVRLIAYGLLLVLAISAEGFLYFADQSARQQEQASQAQIEADKKALKEFVERVNAKRQAEEEARKQAAKESAERAKKNITTAPKPAAKSNCNHANTHNNPNSIDIIVNKKHCLVPLDYAPNDMRTVYGATLRDKAATAYVRMIDVAARDGFSIRATSSYRSYAQQVATYNHWVSVNGSVTAADTVSARPGYSEHQTGLTVDVATGECSLECFGGTKAYTWMTQHAHKYGFIERYPRGESAVTGYSPEPWHYRYVGTATARDMRNKGVATLEEYWNIPGGGY